MNRQLLVAIILASSGLASGADPCGQRPVDALKQAASDIFGPGDHVVKVREKDLSGFPLTIGLRDDPSTLRNWSDVVQQFVQPICSTSAFKLQLGNLAKIEVAFGPEINHAMVVGLAFLSIALLILIIIAIFDKVRIKRLMKENTSLKLDKQALFRRIFDDTEDF